MDKTLYLHIGMPKTGTSTIQYFCDENKKRLLQDGIMYRKMPWKFDNGNIRRNGFFLKKTDLSVPEAAGDEERRNIHNEAFDLIRAWFDEADNVLLTDEGIWDYIWYRGYGVIQELRDFAGSIGASLKIIVYLRRQDEWFNSMYQQRVKQKTEYVDPESFLAKRYRKMCFDYDAQLTELEAIVGYDNIIVRRFVPVEFYQGYIEYDFLHAMGINDFDGYEPQQKMHNPSPLMNHIEVKRIQHQYALQKHR